MSISNPFITITKVPSHNLGFLKDNKRQGRLGHFFFSSSRECGAENCVRLGRTKTQKGLGRPVGAGSAVVDPDVAQGVPRAGGPGLKGRRDSSPTRQRWESTGSPTTRAVFTWVPERKYLLRSHRTTPKPLALPSNSRRTLLQSRSGSFRGSWAGRTNSTRPCRPPHPRSRKTSRCNRPISHPFCHCVSFVSIIINCSFGTFYKSGGSSGPLRVGKVYCGREGRRPGGRGTTPPSRPQTHLTHQRPEVVLM